MERILIYNTHTPVGKLTPRYNHIFEEHNPVVSWGTPVLFYVLYIILSSNSFSIFQITHWTEGSRHEAHLVSLINVLHLCSSVILDKY
jgi:hypothetical protein